MQSENSFYAHRPTAPPPFVSDLRVSQDVLRLKIHFKPADIYETRVYQFPATYTLERCKFFIFSQDYPHLQPSNYIFMDERTPGKPKPILVEWAKLCFMSENQEESRSLPSVPSFSSSSISIDSKAEIELTLVDVEELYVIQKLGKSWRRTLDISHISTDIEGLKGPSSKSDMESKSSSNSNSDEPAIEMYPVEDSPPGPLPPLHKEALPSPSQPQLQTQPPQPPQTSQPHRSPRPQSPQPTLQPPPKSTQLPQQLSQKPFPPLPPPRLHEQSPPQSQSMPALPTTAPIPPPPSPPSSGGSHDVEKRFLTDTDLPPHVDDEISSSCSFSEMSKDEQIAHLLRKLDEEEKKRKKIEGLLLSVEEYFTSQLQEAETKMISQNVDLKEMVSNLMNMIRFGISELHGIMDHNQYMQNKIKKEIVEAEQNFVNHVLEVIVKQFYFPLSREKILSQEDLMIIFGDILPFYNCHVVYLKKYIDHVEAGLDVGSVLMERIIELQSFDFCFITRHKRASEKIVHLKATNPRFREFMEGLERKPIVHGMTLNSLLLKPVNHFCYTRALLEKYLNCLKEDDRDFNTMQDLVERMRNLLDYLDKKEAEERNVFLLETLQECILNSERYVHFLKEGRKYISEGELIEFRSETNKEKFYFFLCNDLLVQTKRQPKKKYKIVRIYCLFNATVTDFSVTGEPYAFVLTCERPILQSTILSAATLQLKEKWMEDLRRSVKALQLREEEQHGTNGVNSYGVM